MSLFAGNHTVGFPISPDNSRTPWEYLVALHCWYVCKNWNMNKNSHAEIMLVSRWKWTWYTGYGISYLDHVRVDLHTKRCKSVTDIFFGNSWWFLKNTRLKWINQFDDQKHRFSQFATKIRFLLRNSPFSQEQASSGDVWHGTGPVRV